MVHALQVTTPHQERIAANNSKSVVPTEDSNAVADVLENTLWNRQLGAMSEEIVAALVCQIFEGITSRSSFSHACADGSSHASEFFTMIDSELKSILQ